MHTCNSNIWETDVELRTMSLRLAWITWQDLNALDTATVSMCQESKGTEALHHPLDHSWIFIDLVGRICVFFSKTGHNYNFLLKDTVLFWVMWIFQQTVKPRSSWERPTWQPSWNVDGLKIGLAAHVWGRGSLVEEAWFLALWILTLTLSIWYQNWVV